MSDLVVALGLVLVIEGALYALAPDAMKRMMARVGEIDPGAMRMGGLIACVVGFGIVWLARSG